MSKNWRVNFLQMQKRLKDLNSYIEVGDFVNAKHMANLLKFSLTFDVAYEEEHRKQMDCTERREK